MTGLTASACHDRLVGGYRLLDTAVGVRIGDWRLQIRSNDRQLLDGLADYFTPYLTSDTGFDTEVVAIECAPPELGLSFIDWRREAGKSGRKDSFLDLSGARLIRKVRTGMVFLQHPRWRIAAGPCLGNPNQVINFVNSQYMNHLQHDGWLICHAAALVRDGRALALAGFSGGGKSTLMLQLMERPAWRYLTNDRLLVRRLDDAVECRGIPKMPRVNPGTLLHHPRLAGLIDDDRTAALQALPRDELWSLEDKHDVMIAEHYGAERLAHEAALTTLVILNWSRTERHPLRLMPVEISGRDDLLGAVMKSPGPFYQGMDGRFLSDATPPDADAYRRVLPNLAVYEVNGRVDFEALASRLADFPAQPAAEGPHVS